MGQLISLLMIFAISQSILPFASAGPEMLKSASREEREAREHEMERQQAARRAERARDKDKLRIELDAKALLEKAEKDAQKAEWKKATDAAGARSSSIHQAITLERKEIRAAIRAESDPQRKAALYERLRELNAEMAESLKEQSESLKKIREEKRLALEDERAMFKEKVKNESEQRRQRSSEMRDRKAELNFEKAKKDGGDMLRNRRAAAKARADELEHKNRDRKLAHEAREEHVRQNKDRAPNALETGNGQSDRASGVHRNHLPKGMSLRERSTLRGGSRAPASSARGIKRR